MQKPHREPETVEESIRAIPGGRFPGKLQPRRWMRSSCKKPLKWSKTILTTGIWRSEAATELCVSRSLLHKKLTAIVDLSANDFITSMRLKKSAVLLQKSNLNISEIAFEVGFNDPKYFSRCFPETFRTVTHGVYEQQSSGTIGRRLS